MKSGTTFLSRLLASHPAVFMCPVKEPCYFVDQRTLRRVWCARWRDGHWKSLERYLSLFGQAGEAAYVAEASTFYSQVPLFEGVAERILALSPEARFIYIMRDPIERTISHYWHVVRWWGERRDILTAIRLEPRYQDVSHYARQLKEYLRHVDARRIYTFTLESLAAQPREQFRALCSWLGIDSSFDPTKAAGDLNETPAVLEQRRGLGLLHRLRDSPTYSRVSLLVPRALRGLGHRLAERSMRPSDVPVSDVARYLRSRQQEQTEELSELLGRDFPEWKTLYAEAVRAPAEFASRRRAIQLIAGTGDQPIVHSRKAQPVDPSVGCFRLNGDLRKP